MVRKVSSGGCFSIETVGFTTGMECIDQECFGSRRRCQP